MSRYKRTTPPAVRDVINTRVKDLEEERFGTIRRVISLLTGRLDLTEGELSQAMGVFAPSSGTSAVSNWCNAKRERPGNKLFSMLELLFLGVIKLELNLEKREKRGRRNLELVVFSCPKCGTPTGRRVDEAMNEIEVCPVCRTKSPVDPKHLSLNFERLNAEVQSFVAVAKNCDAIAPELKDLVVQATIIKSYPTGVEIWYPRRSQVAQWTPEMRTKLLEVIDHTFGPENPTPPLVIKQHNLAAAEGNVTVF